MLTSVPKPSAQAMKPISRARLLARLLEQPEALSAVRTLSGERFRELVTRVGLEDAGEIVALASVAQLEAAFDDDLFLANEATASVPDEELDIRRFLLWVEVLREAGDAFAAERLASLSEDFLALVVEASALVLDQDALGGALSELGAADALDALIKTAPTEEIDRFLLVARRHEGWDALVAVLVTMDQDHHELLARVLEKAGRAGLETLLGYDQDLDDEGPLGFRSELASDVRAEREERRTARGFVAPSDARAFLTAAREGVGAPDVRDPTTRFVLRDQARARPEPRESEAIPDRDEAPKRLEALAALEALVSEEPRRRPVLTVAPSRRFPRLLQDLLAKNPALYTERVEEVAYLVNALVAGTPLAGRTLRPVEAFEVASGALEIGLDLGGKASRAAVVTVGADVMFRKGFGHVHREVALPAAHAANALLERHGRGRELERAAAVRALAGALERGRPWLARAAFLDAVDAEERDQAEALAGFFDACPHFSTTGQFFASLSDVANAIAMIRRIANEGTERKKPVVARRATRVRKRLS